MDIVPYSAEVLISLVARQNDALSPLAYIMPVLALILAGLFWRGYRGAWIGLGAAWIAVALGYFASWLSELTWAWWAFAQGFGIQGVLLAIYGMKGVLPTDVSPGRQRLAATLMMAGALFPVLAVLGRYHWEAAPVFALTPTPTVLFTFGALMLAGGRARLVLGFIPLVWAVLNGVQSWELGLWPDLVLPIVAGLFVIGSVMARLFRL